MFLNRPIPLPEIKMNNVPNVSLSNGVLMPAAVFGVYQIKDAKQCQKAVEDALAAGYRAIDTAASYGNEAAVKGGKCVFISQFLHGARD